MCKYFLTALFIISIFSCDSMNTKKEDGAVLPKSSGKYGEVLVVVDSTYKNSILAVDKIFNKEVEALPQREAMFRMSKVDSKNFKSILKRGRNIVLINIFNNSPNGIKKRENVWAKNQLVVEINAKSDEEAAELLKENTLILQDYFNEIEIQRLQNQFAIKSDKKLISIIKERFNLELTLPPAFVLMDSSGHGLWIKKEKEIGQHGIVQALLFYELDFISDSAFRLNQMIQSRNEFCESHVQGSNEGSYMNVYEEYTPIEKEINLNGLYAVSYKGLWNMKNDFMGGPFVHYVFVDEKRQKVIHAEGFVYAPKFDKREYLRELEAILKTIKI